MPIIFSTHPTPESTLTIWNINEPIESLIEQYRAFGTADRQWETMNNPKRKREYLATRLLVAHQFAKPEQIIYLPSGRPTFKNPALGCLSLSHTNEFAALLTAPTAVGIDAEIVTSKIRKLSPRFTNKEELNTIETATYPDQAATTIWCAKEALFKIAPDNIPDFTTDIHIKITKSGIIEATQIKKTDYKLQTQSYYFEPYKLLIVAILDTMNNINKG